jgi:hypothetical protein
MVKGRRVTVDGRRPPDRVTRVRFRNVPVALNRQRVTARTATLELLRGALLSWELHLDCGVGPYVWACAAIDRARAVRIVIGGSLRAEGLLIEVAKTLEGRARVTMRFCGVGPIKVDAKAARRGVRQG